MRVWLKLVLLRRAEFVRSLTYETFAAEKALVFFKNNEKIEEEKRFMKPEI